MKKRSVCAVLAFSFCSFGFGQLMETLDPQFPYTYVGSDSGLVVAAFTFSTVLSKEPGKDGPPPVQVEGNLIIYSGGATLLSILPTPSWSEDTWGRLAEISLYRPEISADGEQSSLNTSMPLEVYKEDALLDPSFWNMESPPPKGKMQTGPEKKAFRDEDSSKFLGIWNTSHADSGQFADPSSVMSFLFWLDLGILGDSRSFIETSYGTENQKGGDLVFKWKSLEEIEKGRSDSYMAIAQLKPFFGDVVAVPEPSTYAAGAFLLLFAAGHFFVRRRQRRAAAARDQ